MSGANNVTLLLTLGTLSALGLAALLEHSEKTVTINKGIETRVSGKRSQIVSSSGKSVGQENKLALNANNSISKVAVNFLSAILARARLRTGLISTLFSALNKVARLISGVRTVVRNGAVGRVRRRLVARTGRLGASTLGVVLGHCVLS